MSSKTVETSTLKKRYERYTEKLINILCVVLVIFHFYTAITMPFPHMIQRPVHVGIALSICFLQSSLKEYKSKVLIWLNRLFSIVMVASVTAVAIYVCTHYKTMLYSFSLNGIEWVLAVLLMIAVLEGARRSMGMALPILSVVIFVYALMGDYIPGIWGHSSFTVGQLLARLFLSDNGIWGAAVRATANVISIFVVFGAVLVATGGAQSLVDLAVVLAGKSHGGAAKVAVLGSAFFGSISGSASANVAATGSVTIPMMKKLGCRPEFAAAVESAASTGGQILPPIMGTASFLMAEILSIPYSTIIIAAAVPAILYFFGAFMGVHFEAMKENMLPIPEGEVPPLKEILKTASYRILIPIALFIIMLACDITPEKGISITLLLCVAVFLVESKIRGELKLAVKKLFQAALDAGKMISMVAALVVCSQIAVCLIGFTGIAVKFSHIVVSLSAGSMILALIFTMLACLILGMGLPTDVAYILAAAAIVPTMQQMGVEVLAAHLFVLYFAILSAITPPVCGAVFVAAPMAKANWVKTGFLAVRLAMAGFIVPYMFIYTPGLLLRGTMPEILIAITSCTIGVLMLASALAGWFLTKVSIWERGLMLIITILTFNQAFITDLIGYALFVCIILIQLSKKKRGSVDAIKHPT